MRTIFLLIALVQSDILNQAGRVPDSVRAAPLDRLPDALLAEGLAGMDRDIEVFTLDIVECIDMLLRRVSSFFARQIESHHTALPEVNGQLRHLQREFHVAHGADDQSELHPEILASPFQSPEDGIDAHRPSAAPFPYGRPEQIVSRRTPLRRSACLPSSRRRPARAPPRSA